MNQKANQIKAAMRESKADLVLKNANFINVFTRDVDKGDIAVVGDTIVGVGEYEGNIEIDCEGMYVTPGLIDAHVHIESSMVTPEIFSHIVLQRGVTTVIADPHEIANVMGKDGLSLMLADSQNSVMDIYFMLPSCVPAVSFEDNGAVLEADDLAEFAGDTRILGLGEVMDVHAVTGCDAGMLAKLEMIERFGKKIDGHSPLLSGSGLNAYITSGVSTGHESASAVEALDKVKKGLYVMLREGSQAKDLERLLPAVNERNYSRFMFCTDDRHIEDLMEEGSIDYCVRKAVRKGLDPVIAYTMASFNAACCYNLKNLGAVAPGYKADLVIFKDLEQFTIQNVMKAGVIYQENSSFTDVEPLHTVHADFVSEQTFQVFLEGDYVNVIRALPHSLKTELVQRKIVNGTIITEFSAVNMIAVIERHKRTGKHFTGFIEGLTLKNAAIAQTIAHDSHNIIVTGDNEGDMVLAVNTLIEEGGGIVFVSSGEVKAFLHLGIAGLMTKEAPESVLEKMKHLKGLAKTHGIQDGFDPYITLGFMALPVIPDLKITARGLFHYGSFSFIGLTGKNEV